MNKIYKIIPKVTLLILCAIGIAAALAFFISHFLGKSVGTLEVAGDFLAIPEFTSTFLCWIYILIALAVIVAVISIVIVLKEMFKTHPYMAIAIIAAIISVPLFFALCYWLLSNPGELFEERLSDACIYETYIYVGVALVTLFWGMIHSIRKN